MATVEKRVIASSVRPARPGAGGAPDAKGVAGAPEPEKKKSKKKLMIIVVAVVLVVAGAAYYFLVMSKASAGPAVEPPPEPGIVVPVTAVSLNLEGTHYLRIGFGLQMIKSVSEAPNTSKAVDLAIELYSGKSVAEVTDPTTREALKAQLLASIEKAYDEEVMGLYFTDYVTQ